jgi:hypothetical protein
VECGETYAGIVFRDNSHQVPQSGTQTDLCILLITAFR